ncbi:MAG: CocE/NonD family hydrolase [Bacteroidetes bacterium]|nr:CocE/NonD family hydrolase [Bacteroidota bacterium]
MIKKISIILFVFFITCSAHAQLFPLHDSIPMRDGKKLAADVYIPSGSQQRPTILIQTPYNKNYYPFLGLPLQVGMNINSSQYNFVIADWRCFYGSTSACTSQVNRGRDGYDCVEWIAQQPWSNGLIGTWGPSALGIVQFQTAKEHPPHLTCCIPIVAGMRTTYLRYFPGGVYRTEYVQMLDLLGYGLSTILLAHPVHDIYWTIAENTTFYPDSIRVPMFMIGGWYDHATEELLESFEGIRTQSDPAVRAQHKLIMGPWTHNTASSAPDSVGALIYPQAMNVSDSLARKFADYYLLNALNGWNSRPVVDYFIMGENTWNSDTSWNTNNLSATNLYFHSNGTMDQAIPSAPSDSQTIVYDPHNPSPTVGGPTLLHTLNQGPYDQTTVVESQNDILTYTTDTLVQNVTLRGKPVAHLKVSSDKTDTDFSIRLTDVYPDGRSMLVLDGIRRMRFRNGYATADTSAMIPGTVYPLDMDLFANTSITFLAGHRIRVDITSSNYPRFDCNLNKDEPMYTSGDTLIANNTVYLDNSRASFISLMTTSFPTQVSIYRDAFDFTVFPNPSPEFVTCTWTIEKESTVKISLTDVTGKEILILEKRKQEPGNYQQKIDLSALSEGIYFLKLSVNGMTSVKKLVRIF